MDSSREPLKQKKAELQDILEDSITSYIIDKPTVTCDGQTYGQESINKWWTKKVTSPNTGLKLQDKTLIENKFVERVIAHHKDFPDQHNQANYIDELTGGIIEDPIITRNGNTYGRSAWLKWLGENPNAEYELSGEKINEKDKKGDLIPNIMARAIIDHYMNGLSDEDLLQNAIKSKNADKVKELLNNKLELFFIPLNEKKENALQLAYNEFKNNDENRKLIKTLLNFANEKLADRIPEMVNWKFSNNETALHIAACVNHPPFAKNLIRAKADINAKSESGYSPLHCAASFGSTNVAQLLFACNVNINQQDDHGNTALHKAVQESQLEIVKLLMDKNANWKLANNEGFTPLGLAHEVSKNVDIKNGIKEQRKEYDTENLLLHKIPNKYRIDANSCQCPISRDVCVDPVVLSDGHTYDRSSCCGEDGKPLRSLEKSPQTREILNHRICIPNKLVKQLTEKFKKTQCHDDSSYYCPLNKKVMRDPVIIETGITYERSAIKKHFESNNTCPVTGKIVDKKILVSNIAVKSIISDFLDKNYPLEIEFENAIKEEKVDKVHEILQNNPDLFFGSKISNDSALQFAYQAGKKKSISALFDYAIKLLKIPIPDIAKMDLFDGQTALHVAVYADHVEATEILVKVIDVNVLDDNMRSPLHLASCKDGEKVIKLLFDQNPDINLQDKSGNTALQVAIFKEDTNKIRLLLEEGADWAIRNNERYPLYIELFPRTFLNALILKKAIIDDNPEKVKEPLADTPEIFFKQPFFKQPYKYKHIVSALQMAYQKKKIKALTALLDFVAEKTDERIQEVLNLKLENNDSPLWVAILAGHVNIARKIIEKNPNLVNQANNMGVTALQFAIENDKPELLENNADLSDDSLQVAVKQKKQAVIQVLLSAGASPVNVPNDTMLPYLKQSKSYWAKLRLHGIKLQLKGQGKGNKIITFLNDLAAETDENERVKKLVAAIEGKDKNTFCEHRSSYVRLGEETRTVTYLRGLLAEISPKYAPEKTSVVGYGKDEIVVRLEYKTIAACNAASNLQLFNGIKPSIETISTGFPFFSQCFVLKAIVAKDKISELKAFGWINEYDKDLLDARFNLSRANDSARPHSQ